MLDLYVAAKVTVEGSDGIIFPSWKWALKSAAGGVLSAAAGMAFEQIVGPNNWERQTSEQLNEIIAKLDQVLAEISALRPFITEQGRERWREALKSRICGRIEDIAGHISAARTNNEINADDRVQFHSAAASLKEAIGDICAYSDQDGSPLGMPLYVSVAAAVPMLNVAQRLLSISKEIINDDLERVARAMDTWSGVMERTAKGMIDQIVPLEDYLINYPREGFIAWTSWGGGDWLDAGPTMEGQPDYICWARGKLNGGTQTGFASGGWERIGVGRYIEVIHQTPDPLWQIGNSIFPMLEPSNAIYTFAPNTLPQVGQNGVVKSFHQVGLQFDALVAKLGEKRGAVLQRWRDARQAQGVAQDMLDQAETFRSFRT